MERFNKLLVQGFAATSLLAGAYTISKEAGALPWQRKPDIQEINYDNPTDKIKREIAQQIFVEYGPLVGDVIALSGMLLLVKMSRSLYNGQDE